MNLISRSAFCAFLLSGAAAVAMPAMAGPLGGGLGGGIGGGVGGLGGSMGGAAGGGLSGVPTVTRSGIDANGTGSVAAPSTAPAVSPSTGRPKAASA